MIKSITAEVEKKNQAGPAPTISATASTEQFDKFHQDLKVWEEKAHKGLDEAIDAERKVHGYSMKVQTDLNGEATVSVSPGKLYVSGFFELLGGRTSIGWRNVEFDIKADTEKIELSNDNGDVVNLSFTPPH